MSRVYITKTAHFLPNRPVANDEMEKYLGLLGERSSWAKSIVLRNNKIINRHYAVDDDGKITHTNELHAVQTSSSDTMIR